MAKNKFNKKEKKKGRSKATVKSDKSKSAKPKAPATTSALATVQPTMRGTHAVAPAQVQRFVIQAPRRAHPDGPTLWIVDCSTGKMIEWFWDSPRVVDAIQPMLVRLHEVVGASPVTLLSGVEQQSLANVLGAIKAIGVAML